MPPEENESVEEPVQQPVEEPEVTPEGTEPTEETPEPDYSHAKKFLTDIEDPEVLAKLDPYVRKWDAGVSRRFQELNSELKPYKELGADPMTLQQALQLREIIDTDPERVYNALAEALGKAAKEQESPVTPTEEEETTTGALPPEIQEKITKLERVVEFMAQQHLDSQKSTKEQEEDAALDEYLGNLKTEFGDFDEQYVLLKMQQGMSGEDAVKAWNDTITGYATKLTGPSNNAPSVLSGGSPAPQDPINPGELGSKDIKNLVADLMAKATQET